MNLHKNMATRRKKMRRIVVKRCEIARVEHSSLKHKPT